LSSTVGTSTSVAALAYPHQRKDFYANGRFWVFWSDGTNLVYATSTDGTTWSSATSVRACTSGLYFSVWFDGTYLHYAYAAGASIYYRRGIPNSDGTITWSAVEQTVSTTYSKANYPMVSVDSNGYVWIGYNDYNGTYHYPYVIKSGNNNGTWGTTPTGFPYQLSTSGASYWVATPVPLTSGKMLIVYAYDGSSIYAKKWDGSAWGTEVATGNVALMGIYHSAVAQGDDVHIAFFASGNYIIYVKYTYSTNSFGTETTLQTTASGIYAAPNICIDTATNNLYVFWAGYPTANHIYYRIYNASTSTWQTAVDWITETSLSANDKIRCFCQSYGSYIGIIYMTGTANPYNVKFAYLSLVTAITVTVTDSVGLSDAALCNKILAVSDSVGLVDTSLKGWTPTVTDAVSLFETVLRNKTFSILDSVGLADVVYRGKQLTLTDAVSLTDAILRNKQFAVQDSISTVESILRNKQFSITDALTLTEVVVVSKLLGVSDSINVSDVALALKTLKISDQIGLFDAVLRNKFMELSDQISLVDMPKTDKELIVTDISQLSDVVLALKVLLVADVITLADFVTVLLLGFVQVFDSVGLADAVKIDKSLLVQDVLVLLDEVRRNKQLTITDVVSAIEVVLVGKMFVMSDSVHVTDAVSRNKLLPILDAVGLSDVILCDKQLIVSDVVHVTETVLRNKVMTLLDSVGLSDVVKVNKIIIVSDELALVELVSAIPQLPHVTFYLPIRLKVSKA